MARRGSRSRTAPEEHTPPSGDRPRAPNFPQPARRGGEDQLPVVGLGSVDMEKFCCGLVRIEYPHLTRAELKRGRGHKQFGADVEGFDTTQRSVVVVSCKCYHEAEARDLLPWAREFTDHLSGHWKDKGVGTFVLAVTCDGNNDDVNAAARQVADHLQTFGIAFDLWTNQKMSDLARKDPGLVSIYFSRYWHDAFFPFHEGAEVIARPGAGATALATPPVIAALSREIASLLSELDGNIAKRIDEAQAAFRGGRVSSLKTCLDDIQNASVWESVTGQARAKTLRAHALLALHAEDGEAAKRLIDEADGHAAPVDRSLRATVLRVTDGPQVALDLLDGAKTERETEVRGSLLLELDEVDQALAELAHSPVGRPESQRLKAIALCLKGEREQAVVIAEEARTSDPHSVLAQQTVGVLHVMAALSPRAPVQFGAMPNPLDPGLVRGTQDALEHLDKAAALFAHLATSLEMPARAEAEIWRFACLILHVDKRADARKLARSLLGRDAIEPLAVAWCRLAGLPLRHGHVRKQLADALRVNQGSPAHVVVDALLAADKDGPSAAVAVIDRHGGQFPEAAGFLAGWRARFAGESEDDVVVAALRTDKADRFIKLAEKIKTATHHDDTVLASAEIMAANGAWAEVHAIQGRLTEVGTPRAVVIAAHAAFNTGDAAEALRLLDAFKACFRHGELPPSLMDLKARAHDALGDKRNAIAEYEQVLARTNDSAARRRLVQTYLGVGNLGSARHHAEQFVFGKSGHPTDAVALADVWKATDPEFSRRLVVHAASDPRLPVQAAPHAFALAIELGLKEVEARLAPIVFDVETHGAQTGVVAIDSVEKLIAHMTARAEGIRQKLSAWLAGQQWSHGTWSSDVRTFALLYLSELEDRYDSIGQRVPMLLSSAGVERPEPAIGEGQPVLVMDISALLLAARLKLVDVLSGIFAIRIPEAVPAAILEMERALPMPSETALGVARQVLLDGDQPALRLVEQAPVEAVALADQDDPSKPNLDLLTTVLGRAVEQGLIDQASSTRAAERFAVQPDALVPGELPDGLVVSRGLVIQLAEAGVLKAICRTIKTYWTAGERAALTSDLARGERMKRYRELLAALRSTIAARLQDSSWSTLPKRFDQLGDKRQDNIRPHVLSLAETAGALESGLSALYWIEDRYVQRWSDARLVNITQILRLLTDRGALSTAERDARRTELRRIGYGFQAPDIDGMVRDILAAPVAQEEVRETPELAAWREWFAGEVEHLEYCSRTLMHDANGRIIGEARHTLDVMSVAREVLWAIWQQADQSDVEKVLRSIWLWSNLRVEQMPFFPVVAAAPKGATSLVAMNFAHIADIPLLSLMQGEEVARGTAKSFLPWLFSVIIDPRCSIDPEFELEFAAHLTRTVIAALGWADGDTEGVDPESLRAHIRSQTSDYLDLLPDAWRDRLLANRALAQRLQVATILTANLGEFEFYAEQLAETITAAISSPGLQSDSERKVVDRSGRQHILQVKANGQDPPTVTLECGEKTMTIDPVVVALHLAGPEERVKALQAAAVDLDGPAEVRARQLETVARQVTVADRIRELRALNQKDFSLTCTRVRECVRNRQSVERVDLTLPDPAVLQAYLRVEDDDGQNAATWPDRAFARLAAELGVEKAVARLAGCPFKLGAENLARIGNAIDTAISDNRLERLRIGTALEALMYVRGAAGRSRDASQATEKLAVRVLDQLVPQAPLFIALLSHAARRAERETTWTSLPRESAALLMWVWADRLTAALVSGGADPDGAAKVRNDELRSLADIIDASSVPGWWRETVRALDDGRLVAGVIGEVAAVIAEEEIAAETEKRLLETGGHFVGEAWLPRLDASFPPEVGPAGYWPAEDAIAKVAACRLTQMLGPFDIRSPNEYARALLAGEVSEAQLPGVLSVLSFIDVSRLDEPSAQFLGASLPALLARSDGSPTNPGYRRGLALLASTLAVTGTAKDCEELILEQARKLAARWPDAALTSRAFEDHTEPHQGLSMLIEMVLAFARNRREPRGEKLRWIGLATEKIVEAWPKSAAGACVFLGRSIERLAVGWAASLWPAFNRLRAKN